MKSLFALKWKKKKTEWERKNGRHKKKDQGKENKIRKKEIN